MSSVPPHVMMKTNALAVRERESSVFLQGSFVEHDLQNLCLHVLVNFTRLVRVSSHQLVSLVVSFLFEFPCHVILSCSS